MKKSENISKFLRISWWVVLAVMNILFFVKPYEIGVTEFIILDITFVALGLFLWAAVKGSDMGDDY